MSPKELQYVEDVLGHEEQMNKSCCAFANQIQDQELKSFVHNLSSQHQQTFSKFYNLLNS